MANHRHGHGAFTQMFREDSDSLQRAASIPPESTMIHQMSLAESGGSYPRFAPCALVGGLVPVEVPVRMTRMRSGIRFGTPPPRTSH